MGELGRPRVVGISARESEVLAALGEHLTNAEIGARVGGGKRRCRGVALVVDAVCWAVGRAGGLSAALREHRLVTAVGPGGVGKTRLALSVAADLSWPGRRGMTAWRSTTMIPFPPPPPRRRAH